ncbi:MAG: hypothetical protein EZS28_036936, partial [Streblomastix strix]
MNSPQPGQAQIKFSYDEDGEEAKNKLNGKMIDGSKITIEFQQIPGNILQQPNSRPPLQAPQQPTEGEDPKSLLISNINPLTTESDMQLIFIAYNIEKFNINPPNQKIATLSGIAIFNKKEAACEALIHVEGKIIDGNNVQIRFNELNPSQLNPILIIRNINPDTSVKSIEDFLEQYHPLNIKLTQDQSAGNGTLIATMNFSNPEQAKQAQKFAHNSFLRGNTLSAQLEIPPPPSSINRSYLIIRNVSSSFTLRTTWLSFLAFNPKSCEVKYNQQTGQNEAHIQFYYEEDAQEAIQHLNGKMIQGQKIKIEFQSVTGRQSPPPQNQPRPPLPIPQQPTQEEDEKILYITNLNPRTSQSDLELVFLGFNVARCAIIPGQSSTQPSSAEVHLLSDEDAHQALMHSKDIKIDNNMIRIRYNRKIPKQPVNVDKLTLFITQLNPTTTNSTLTEAFRPYNAIRCSIPTGQKGTKIHGFANFSNETDAGNALQNLNGKSIDGNNIRIKYKDIPLPPTQNNKREIQIKNLDSSTNKRTLELIFKPFSPIDINMNSPQPGQAQIKFSYDEDGEEAKNKLNGKMIDGSRISIEFQQIPGNVPQQQNQRPPLQIPQKPTEGEDPKSLLISNINPITSEADMKLVFIAYNIKEFTILPPNPRSATLSGIAIFSKYEDAREALIHVDGKIIDGNNVTIKYQETPLPPTQNNKREIQIKNLDPSTNKRTLELIFKPFSPIDINMNSPQPGQAQIKFSYDEDGEEA